MDIRFINNKKEIINVSNLSIKRMNNFLIGINERQEMIVIEEYENEKEAEEKLKEVANEIIKADLGEYESIILFSKEGENKEWKR